MGRVHFLVCFSLLELSFAAGTSYGAARGAETPESPSAAGTHEKLLSGKLSDYGLTVPFSSDSHGRFVSHVLSMDDEGSSSSRRRKTRSRRAARRAPDTSSAGSGSGSDFLFFNVTVFGKELHLRLRANRRLVAPGASLERQEDFEAVAEERLHADCVFTGDVGDMPHATVAVSNCDGLAGLIRTDSGEFFIEPLEKGRQDAEAKGRVHVVYRRSALKRQTGRRGGELRSQESDFGIADLPAAVDLLKRQVPEPERKRRHAEKDDYNIEVLLAVDDSVVRFHGKEHVQNYVLTLMNIIMSSQDVLGTTICSL